MEHIFSDQPVTPEQLMRQADELAYELFEFSPECQAAAMSILKKANEVMYVIVRDRLRHINGERKHGEIG